MGKRRHINPLTSEKALEFVLFVADKEKNINEIMKNLKISQSMASDYLNRLHKFDFIIKLKKGRITYYTVNWERMKEEFVNFIEEFDKEILDIVRKIERERVKYLITKNEINKLKEVLTKRGIEEIIKSFMSAYAELYSILTFFKSNLKTMIEDFFKMIYYAEKEKKRFGKFRKFDYILNDDEYNLIVKFGETIVNVEKAKLFACFNAVLKEVYRT